METKRGIYGEGHAKRGGFERIVIDGISYDEQDLRARVKSQPRLLSAAKNVSFYARINHGTKCKDYGEIVDPILKEMGVEPGVM